jgi:putative ABC transport system permease protein
VLSSTTAAFTFLLVATLLTVSVNQRLGEVAALRALGIARRKIAATLLWEAALLVGVGGLLALPLGELLAVGLDGILRRMPGLPEGLHFFVFEPRALVLHAALLAATAVVAALYPMWLAVTLPIARTLRQEVVS